MKITMIQNGTISMVIVPETEIEKLQLKLLFSGQVDSKIADRGEILDKNIADSVIITPQTKQITKEI